MDSSNVLTQTISRDRILLLMLFVFSVSAMEDKKEIVVSGLKPLCNNDNNKVSQTSMKIILRFVEK